MPKDKRDEMFEKVRAGQAYAGTARTGEEQELLELAAFMDIFHPKPGGRSRAELKAMITK